MASKQKILTVIAPYEYGKENSRAIAHGIKAGDDTAITEAARVLASCIHTPVTLVPVPNSSGKAETTLALAKKIAQFKQGVTVSDVLYGAARNKAYDIKRSGERVDRQEYGYRLRTTVLPDHTMLLDNCADTLRTASEAAAVSGVYTLLTYAVTTKKKCAHTNGFTLQAKLHTTRPDTKWYGSPRATTTLRYAETCCQ